MPNGQVLVTIPARAEYVRVLRVMAGNSAAAADLGYDRVDDVSLAVDECAALVLETGNPAAITASFTVAGGALSVAVSSDAGAGVHPSPDRLRAMVLDSITTEWEAGGDGAHPRVGFRVEA